MFEEIWDRFRFGFALASGAMRTLMRSPLLLIFPCAGFAALAFSLLFIAGEEDPTGVREAFHQMLRPGNGGSAFLLLFGLCLAIYIFFNFVMVLMDYCLIFSAGRVLSGRPSGIFQAILSAAIRLPLIFAWSVFAATFGVFCGIMLGIAHGSRGWLFFLDPRRWMLGWFGATWSALIYFVLPVMVFERKYLFAALDRSRQLLTENWGEGIAGAFGFGYARWLAAFACGALVYWGIDSGAPELTTVAALLFTAALVLASTAESILHVAVYAFALKKNLKNDCFGDLAGVFYYGSFNYGDVGRSALDPRRGRVDNALRSKSTGRTQLHEAAGQGNIAVVRALLHRGADAFAMDPEGKMPIDLAVASGYGETAETLREYMAAHSPDDSHFQA